MLWDFGPKQVKSVSEFQCPSGVESFHTVNSCKHCKWVIFNQRPTVRTPELLREEPLVTLFSTHV